MKIALGMSGGVDSSAAAIILKNKGYEVLGATMCLFDGSLPPFNDMSISEDAAAARAVCERLSIEHLLIDGRADFYDAVIKNFIAEYYAGNTPNPCIVCNKAIKFGVMLKKATDLGCDKIATGHYARIEKCGERYLLKKSLDTEKDQSYVLYVLNQDALARTEFPLGCYTKPQIREIARELGLINAEKKDSQDICFVPEGDYAAFIARAKGENYPKGNYLNLSGEILGQHEGMINYTIGQRKGLRLALGRPQFVISKNAADNTVVLGDEEHLFKKTVMVKDVNWIACDALTSPINASAKLRYRHKEAPALIHPLSQTEVLLEFDTPQRAPSSGQSAVFYDGDTVIGGGIIE